MDFPLLYTYKDKSWRNVIQIWQIIHKFENRKVTQPTIWWNLVHLEFNIRKLSTKKLVKTFFLYTWQIIPDKGAHGTFPKIDCVILSLFKPYVFLDYSRVTLIRSSFYHCFCTTNFIFYQFSNILLIRYCTDDIEDTS